MHKMTAQDLVVGAAYELQNYGFQTIVGIERGAGWAIFTLCPGHHGDRLIGRKLFLDLAICTHELLKDGLRVYVGSDDGCRREFHRLSPAEGDWSTQALPETDLKAQVQSLTRERDQLRQKDAESSKVINGQAGLIRNLAGLYPENSPPLVSALVKERDKLLIDVGKIADERLKLQNQVHDLNKENTRLQHAIDRLNKENADLLLKALDAPEYQVLARAAENLLIWHPEIEKWVAGQRLREALNQHPVQKLVQTSDLRAAGVDVLERMEFWFSHHTHADKAQALNRLRKAVDGCVANPFEDSKWPAEIDVLKLKVSVLTSDVGYYKGQLQTRTQERDQARATITQLRTVIAQSIEGDLANGW